MQKIFNQIILINTGTKITLNFDEYTNYKMIKLINKSIKKYNIRYKFDKTI